MGVVIQHRTASQLQWHGTKWFSETEIRMETNIAAIRLTFRFQCRVLIFTRHVGANRTRGDCKTRLWSKMLFINAGNRYIFCNFSFRNDHEQNEQLVARPRHGQSTARQNLAAWRVSEIESCRESKVSIIFLYIFPPQIMSNHSCMGPVKTENVSLRSNSWARACVF